MSRRTKQNRSRGAGGRRTARLVAPANDWEKSFVIPPPNTPRQKIFALVSSAHNDWMPEWPKPWRKESGDEPGAGWGNHFVYGGTQVNADLAALAACEQKLLIDFGGAQPNGFDMLRSPMFWNLRQSFVESAAAGDSFAFADAVYRAYMAGRISPDRLLLPEGSCQVSRKRGDGEI